MTDLGKDANSNSRFSVFLDNFDQGNGLLASATGSFVNELMFEQTRLLGTTDLNGPFKNTFAQINLVAADNNMNNYQKTSKVGFLLEGIANQIVTADNPEIKQSGIRVLNSFLNVAKETQDQQLISTAVRISNAIHL